jgi:hypothetical protein
MTEQVLPGTMLDTPANKLPLRLTPDGWHVLEVRGERDVPGYDPAVVGAGMGDQLYRREVLGDWSATTGKLVYPEFKAIHVAKKALDYDERLPLICGWDLPGSNGGTPAMVPAQLNKRKQLLIYPPVVPDEGVTVGIYEFGGWVAEYLSEEFAIPSNLTLESLHLLHYGDPAGNAKMASAAGTSNARLEARSANEILLSGMDVIVGWDDDRKPIIEHKPGWGWVMQPGEMALSRRMECMRSRLSLLVEGEPALLVDPAATILIDGFQGGYHYHQRADGRFELDPAKNHYSHPLNALEYLVSRVGGARPRAEQDEDDGPKRRERTRAAGRGRWR